MLRTYGEGLFTGNPAQVSNVEIKRYNALQFSQSRRFVFSYSNDFDAATARRPEQTEAEFIERDSLMNLGRMGEGWPPRPGMPDGWTLVVRGQCDHCLLHIEEVDEDGEGITARTVRDYQIAHIKANGRISWQKASGYNQRSRVETHHLIDTTYRLPGNEWAAGRLSSAPS